MAMRKGLEGSGAWSVSYHELLFDNNLCESPKHEPGPLSTGTSNMYRTVGAEIESTVWFSKYPRDACQSRNTWFQFPEKGSSNHLMSK